MSGKEASTTYVPKWYIPLGANCYYARACSKEGNDCYHTVMYEGRLIRESKNGIIEFCEDNGLPIPAHFLNK